MNQRARLITPRGKKIDLSPEMYRQIQQLLTLPTRNRTRARIDKVIAATYGKYANGESLTQALRQDHADERARENRKLIESRG